MNTPQTEPKKRRPKRPRTVLTDTTPVTLLHRDLITAAATMSAVEARFLVDLYYSWQDDRKAADNQVFQMEKEPHGVLAWLADQSGDLEKQIVKALDSYTDAQRPVRALAQGSLRHRPRHLGRTPRAYRHPQVSDRRPHLALRRPRSDSEVAAQNQAALERQPQGADLEDRPELHEVLGCP